MKFKDVVKSLSGPLAQVAASFIPGGTQILAAVNAFAPEGEKLPETATGFEISKRVNEMPLSQRATLLEKEIDLAIEQERGWTDRYTAMTKADGQTTRPRIALLMAFCVVFVVVFFSAVLMIEVWNQGFARLDKIADVWPVFAAVLGIPSAVLNKYFGELRKEQGQRLGVSAPDLVSTVRKVIGG